MTIPTPPKPSDEIPEFIAKWWRDKPPELIATIALGHRLLWPDTLKVRAGAGEVREVPIYLQTPNAIDKMQAVVATNAKIAELFNVPKDRLPLSREDATRLVGETEYGVLHSAYLMAFCIVEHEPIKGREDGARRLMYLPQTIIQSVGMASLYDLYNRLELYGALEDVRISEISPELFDGYVKNIARCMSLAPLFGFSGAAFDRFVVMMAERIASLEKQLQASGDSSSASPSTSTPD